MTPRDREVEIEEPEGRGRLQGAGPRDERGRVPFRDRVTGALLFCKVTFPGDGRVVRRWWTTAAEAAAHSYRIIN